MRSRLPILLFAAAATTVYALIGQAVFGGRPLHVDEITQAFQARILASGHLWIPTPEPPEFFSALLVVNREGRTFAQFPPGWPLHLALGYLLHAPWLVAPLCGGLALLALDQLLRATGEPARTRVAAVTLFAVSPWVAFNTASWMNHAPATFWLLAGLAATFTASGRETRRGWLFAVGGLAFGIAFSIRPVDGVAYLIPVGVWLGLALRTNQIRWQDGALFGAGVAIPVAAFLVFNHITTGDAFLLGYEAQWGAAHRLGFHEAPWGPPHTVARGWTLISGYYRQLQWAMYESPVPALLAPVLAMLLTRRFRAADVVVLGCVGLLTLAYFAYWFEADYLGPRYLFPLAPVIALWTARLPGLLIERGANRWLAVGAAVLIGTNVVAGLLIGTPARWRQYAAYAPARRWDADSALAAAGINDAVILVREPWLAQVSSRLVGRGVPRAIVERLSRNTDVCVLDLSTALFERDDRRWPEIAPALQRLMRDSLRLVPNTKSPDPSAMMLSTFVYPPRCEVRAHEDRLGTVPLVPLLLAGRGGSLFARDLHELTPRLLEAQVGRRVLLLSMRRSVSGGTVRTFEPFDLDSAARDWRAATPH
jgi:hypothetical protein